MQSVTQDRDTALQEAADQLELLLGRPDLAAAVRAVRELSGSQAPGGGERRTSLGRSPQAKLEAATADVDLDEVRAVLDELRRAGQ